MNKAEREIFAQCQGACQVCLLAGGCDLEKKLARRTGAGVPVIIGALVLALSLTTGTAEAKKGKLEARQTASGEIVYIQTPDTVKTPKAPAVKASVYGPIYDASGALRGMRYNMTGKTYRRNCQRSIMGTGAQAVSVEVCQQ